MKLNTTQVVNRKAGMTLLELTVVILVLLSLISILFVGARAWKKGSDRSACIINIRNTQQAVRGYLNMNQGKTLAELTATNSIEDTMYDGDDAYLKEPVCPADPDRSYATSYLFEAPSQINPPLGTIFLSCLILPAGEDGAHLPDNTDDW